MTKDEKLQEFESFKEVFTKDTPQYSYHQKLQAIELGEEYLLTKVK